MNVNDYVFWVPCGPSSLTVNKNNKKNLALTRSLNYEIFRTKANFPLGERDFHERISNGSFKTAWRPKFKIVLCLRFEFMPS